MGSYWLLLTLSLAVTAHGLQGLEQRLVPVDITEDIVSPESLLEYQAESEESCKPGDTQPGGIPDSQQPYRQPWQYEQQQQPPPPPKVFCDDDRERLPPRMYMPEQPHPMFPIAPTPPGHASPNYPPPPCGSGPHMAPKPPPGPPPPLPATLPGPPPVIPQWAYYPHHQRPQIKPDISDELPLKCVRGKFHPYPMDPDELPQVRNPTAAQYQAEMDRYRQLQQMPMQSASNMMMAEKRAVNNHYSQLGQFGSGMGTKSPQSIKAANNYPVGGNVRNPYDQQRSSNNARMRKMNQDTATPKPQSSIMDKTPTNGKRVAPSDDKDTPKQPPKVATANDDDQAAPKHAAAKPEPKPEPKPAPKPAPYKAKTDDDLPKKAKTDDDNFKKRLANFDSLFPKKPKTKTYAKESPF